MFSVRKSNIVENHYFITCDNLHYVPTDYEIAKMLKISVDKYRELFCGIESDYVDGRTYFRTLDGAIQAVTLLDPYLIVKKLTGEI